MTTRSTRTRSTTPNYGFDSTGDEVHADGEIWNGTQWEVRQALVKKWNARFPYADKALQARCAQGPRRTQPRWPPACAPATGAGSS